MYYNLFATNYSKEEIMLGTIILVLLILFLIGGLPTWGYSREWGYRPVSIIAVILVIYLILVLIGRVPLG